MCLPTIKGYCKDCFYKARVPEVVDDTVVLDQICQMTELFTPDDGYCHHFQRKDW